MSVLVLRRLMRRRRRCVAALSLVLALGVFAHHSMPESAMGSMGAGMSNHGGMTAHPDGMALMAMCLGLVAMAGVWTLGRLPRWRRTCAPHVTVRPRLTRAAPRPQVVPRARAGPLHMVVLRL